LLLNCLLFLSLLFYAPAQGNENHIWTKANAEKWFEASGLGK